MLEPVSNRKSVLACSADCPADNHARQLCFYTGRSQYGLENLILLNLKMTKNYFKLLTFLILLSSCEDSPDKKKVTIENFNEQFVDSLAPIPDKHYSVFYTKITGYSNDTIRLNISSDKTPDSGRNYYFIDNFEEEIRLDYYGGSNKYITFDPYEAAEGKVELTYRL